VRLRRLRAVRDAKVLSQQELASKSGVTKTTIVHIEGGPDAHPATIRKLAEALGVEPAELMEKAKGAE
jgi:transcriptional regulator with XRE-family HTH domain